MADDKVKLFAISGSLRAASYNTALLRALKIIASPQCDFDIFDHMSAIPLFNPDRESESIEAVRKLKLSIKMANGLIIASPEYAHGISGVLKNLLDWLVSGEEFVNKPIMLINTSPRAKHAQLALREVINTMSGRIVEQASVAVPLLGSEFDAKGIAENIEMKNSLRAALTIFIDNIHQEDVAH